ncbi:MAG: 2-amino-4-hydroxy-6-hydroxymethyldihydropteridine diphosphokinase [Alphaproteobacteria bacterium]
MILIGIGSNLPSDYGPPRETCAAALDALEREPVRITARSRWYRSSPVPLSDQPWFVNGVIAIETELDPEALLAALHRVEAEFGRAPPQERAAKPNAARPLDLDLLAYDELVREGPEPPILPHPRMAERAFVLLPLREIAPDWRDSESGEPLSALVEALSGEGIVQPID